MAPVPEQGVFGLWALRSISAWPPHLVCGSKWRRPKKDARFDDITRIFRFEPEYDRVFTSVLRAQDRFILRNCQRTTDRMAASRSTSATCRLLWTLDFANNNDSWRLEGALDMTDRALTPISMNQSQRESTCGIWRNWGITALAKCGKWKASEQRLAVSLQSLSAVEQDSFAKRCGYQRSKFAGKDGFRNAR